jgi:hypothetical protein
VHHEISENAILSFLFDQETGVEQGEAETSSNAGRIQRHR